MGILLREVVVLFTSNFVILTLNASIPIFYSLHPCFSFFSLSTYLQINGKKTAKTLTEKKNMETLNCHNAAEVF